MDRFHDNSQQQFLAIKEAYQKFLIFHKNIFEKQPLSSITLKNLWNPKKLSKNHIYLQLIQITHTSDTLETFLKIFSLNNINNKIYL